MSLDPRLSSSLLSASDEKLDESLGLRFADKKLDESLGPRPIPGYSPF